MYLSITSGFWPCVRARALRAPVFWAHCRTKRGAARPPPIPALLLLIRPQRINGNYTKIMYRCVHTPLLFSFYSCFYTVFDLFFLFISSYSSLLFYFLLIHLFLFCSSYLSLFFSYFSSSSYYFLLLFKQI